MGVKLDMDINTVLIPWKITYVQTHAFEGEVDDRIRTLYVIAPDKESAEFWSQDLNHHGDLYDVLLVEPAACGACQIDFASYQPENVEYYVLFGVESGQHQFKGPFEYEFQAEKYAKGVDKTHNPRVVVHYREDDK